MKKFKFGRIAKAAMTFSATAMLVVGLNGCGGGGGGDSSTGSDATIRPKSMDSTILTIDAAMRFEFFRTTGTGAAIRNGQTERGTFIYTRTGNQRTSNTNALGTTTGVSRPDAVSGARYTYRAINDTSGVLTLTAVAVDDLIVQGGDFNSLNGQSVRLFERDSSFNTQRRVVIDVTFATDGSFVATGDLTVRVPGNRPLIETLVMPSVFTLSSGAQVPVNYNPSDVDTRDSLIVTESLNNLLFRFTNGIPNTALDFTIQFVADGTGSTTLADIDEIGQGLLRVNGASVNNAVDYTWTRTPGTDDGTLVLSGSGLTFDGTYTLSFTGVDTGFYRGRADSDTQNAADVSGTFRIPSL